MYVYIYIIYIYIYILYNRTLTVMTDSLTAHCSTCTPTLTLYARCRNRRPSQLTVAVGLLTHSAYPA